MFKKIIGLGFPSKGKNAKIITKYIDNLVKSGAQEFFIGYNPSYWSEKFGFEVSPNGRFSEHEQVTDLDTLKEIVKQSHNNNIEIFANLNARYYTKETMPYIERIVKEFIEIGIDGIICGNISILEYLKKINYSGKINVSTILSIYNKEAIKFMIENYKINKFILPREVTLKEIKSITKHFPKIKFEVFGEGDFCRYNNGLCFAEHKYGTKDICTVIINNLIIRKKFRPDFKEFILDKNISNQEKIYCLNDEYINDFEKISQILGKIDLGFNDKKDLENKLLQIVLTNKTRIDLFFDGLKPLNSTHNNNVLNYLRAIKYLIKNKKNITLENIQTLEKLKEELNNSYKSYIKYNTKKLKLVGGKPKLKALELGNFYARSDNLNIYSYLFFNEIKNIDTVKFPTRGRNYQLKIQIINNVIKEGKINKSLLDRGVSLERTHYDLSHLFGDKLWFRKFINSNSI